MKTQLLIPLCLFLYCNCNRAQEWEGPINDFSVLMNAEPWEDNPPSLSKNQILRPVKKVQGFYEMNCPDTTITIRMIRGNYKNSVYNLEELYFHKLPLKIGKYHVIEQYPQCHQDTLTRARFVPLIGDDVLGDAYEILDNEKSFVSIHSFNQNVIKGKFQVSFINLNDETDTVRFTEGKFKISKIQYP